MGEGSGEEREGKLNAKKETNKQKKKNGMGWVEGEVSPSLDYHVPGSWVLVELPDAKPSQVSPVVCGVFFFFFFFLLLPLPMLGRFLSSLTYFIHRKGCPALGSSLRLCPWCATLSLVPKAV